ncbi:MAG: biopolymer transporter ExbD [Vicinamibacteria bacterium]
MGEINVTPLVDVLVLLLVFMVTAPDDEPRHRRVAAGREPAADPAEDRITVSVRADGRACSWATRW